MRRNLLWLLIVVCMLGCTQQQFYLPSEQQVFQQNRSSTNKVIDVLWVIDNSKSMETSQTNLANNLDAFIGGFVQKGLSFKMAFTTTDAYQSLFTGNLQLSHFRDGSDQFGHSGVPIIMNTTPNIENVFLMNARVGTAGNGDERAFQSLRETLINPGNQNFLRPDSFFSVIIISDEEDYSWDGSTPATAQTPMPPLHPISTYINFLDSFTSSLPSNRKYSVSSISIQDQACLTQLGSGRRMGVRYKELSEATNGYSGNLCSNFGDTLAKISGKILELLTSFKLNREPDISTIQVAVDGKVIPNDAQNGWTYDSAKNAIFFHGTSVPGEGQQVIINYQPTSAR